MMLEQYINNRIKKYQRELDKALETYTGYIIPVGKRINAAASKAEKDIFHAIWGMSVDELSIEDQQSMILQLQKIISDMRMDAVEILRAKNGGTLI